MGGVATERGRSNIRDRCNIVFFQQIKELFEGLRGVTNCVYFCYRFHALNATINL